jgi:hypothetical protein
MALQYETILGTENCAAPMNGVASVDKPNLKNAHAKPSELENGYVLEMEQRTSIV